MYGWRARIGCIVPSSGTVAEAEWQRSVPEDVIIVSSRVLIEDVTRAGVEAMTQQFERAARELASAAVNAIVQVGTPAGFIEGNGAGRPLSERLEALTGIPTVSMMSACLEALKAVGLKRIVVATPYVEDLNVRLRTSLEAAGFEILAFKGLGIEKNLDINALYPETAYRAAREVFQLAPDADGVFISCAGWRTFEALEELEQDLGVPIVTSSSAGLWKGLSLAGVRVRLAGLGMLLRGDWSSGGPAAVSRSASC